MVNYANSLNKDISELTLDEIKNANEKLKDIDKEVLKVLDLKDSANSRKSFGGTAKESVLEQIKIIQKWLEKE